MKEIIKWIHVKRQMKHKTTNLCMPEISPRIYQSCHVRPIPVRADYFVLTVDLRSAKRGGWRHKVNKKKIKKNIAAPLNGLFSAVYPSIFSKNKLPLFFFLLPLLHLASLNCPPVYFLPFSVSHFSYIPLKWCVKWEDSSFLHWNRCGSAPQPIRRRHRHSAAYRSKKPKMQPRKHRHLPENWRC